MLEILAMFKDYIGLVVVFIVAAAALILVVKYVSRSVFKEMEQYHDKRDEKVIKLAITYIGAICSIFVNTMGETNKVMNGEETLSEKITNMLIGMGH